MAKHLGLNLKAVTDAQGNIDESKTGLEPATALLSFSSNKLFPANDCRSRKSLINCTRCRSAIPAPCAS